ncbi:hypothetical protein EX895_003911 [Sporisorium graminicola]|uniref:Zn(2)-C6 fungal-type domain-containing protein n=1 Tax=Sporisorium graminicola TaxID=280036 RepID=A0A4U7KRX9_9BASI|nr:hypothetical protein EX895_003911 [Sporisorium graminicola]TKY87234.1 hypothetical protein EX895_003911 [Sporisorium graminicola]
MSAAILTAATFPGQDDIHHPESTSSPGSPESRSSPNYAASASKKASTQASISTSMAFPTTPGPARPSPKTPSSTHRADKDKKHDKDTATPRDNDKGKDKEREARLPACEACRTRKVKCDALLPACTPCRKSGRECFGRDKVPNVSRGLVYELQQKVKDLESRLALASSGSIVDASFSANGDLASDGASANGSRSSRVGGPPAKRTKRGRNGRSSFDDGAQSAESGQESSSSDSASSTPEPTDPSPNDFVQQTSTILESLSSDLTGSAHRQHQHSPSRSTTQTLDNDEASALAALTRHHKDRAKSPHRPKRRSSSNASKYRDEASSYFVNTARLRDATTPYPFKSRSRPSRSGTISAYDRTFFDRLIARYLTYMNTALPVINEIRMRELAALVYQDDERSRLAALSVTPYDSMPPPPLPPSPAIDRITLSKHRYVVLMSLAIALASLGRSHNFSPELRRLGHQYWAEAQALMPVLFRFGDLDKLRATLLQLQYALLVPTAGSVWELSGAAIRLVTELNLQVDRDFDSAANAPFTQETIDLRRRLFWTAYCLDRSLAVALARPPGLSDAWIHVQLPSLLSDADILRSDRESGAPTVDDGRTDPQKHIFRSHINLRRVQSEILCRLHSVNPRDYSLDNDVVSLSQPVPTRPSLALVMEVGPPTPNIEWQSRMMDKLGKWRSEYDRWVAPSLAERPVQSERGVGSTATPFITRDWIDLNHNLAISLLFRPSPNNPRPDSNGLQQAFIASGRAMKIYKSMHRSSTINFPWLATHHLFISGLTHLNALEKLTRTGVASPSPVVEVVFNVQSCASTLEALTGRDDGYGMKVRDTFDAAASAVLRSVLEPGSAARGDVGTGEGLVAVEELMRGSATGSLNGRQQQHSTLSGTASLVEASNSLRRASHHHNHHHEALLQAAQQQHPTWLSDSTWNSINTMDTAPPPGSTIFVAAPPRVGRYGTPGHSLVPTLSERTTQTAAMGHTAASGMGLGAVQSSTPAVHSPRSFAMLAPAAGMAFGSDTFQGNGGHGGHGDVGQAHRDANGASSAVDADRSGATAPSTSTFGFHNWLLQPYEGGADGMGGFGTSSAGGNGLSGGGSASGFSFSGTGFASPSTYAGVDPFQGVYGADGVQPQQAPSRGSMAGQDYAMVSGMAANDKEAAETDASTLLDFLSMLPPSSTAGSPAGKVGSAGGMQGKS